ncbi:MAG TPA: membrane protein insertase YidC [Chitinophagaceae bacterium]|nr:membrane protein insertase YidC [Chitinophagaceae bacterium]
MKTDKNTIIGFALLAILFFAFFYVNNQQQAALQAEKQRIEDSVAKENAKRKPVVDVAKQLQDSLYNDSLSKVQAAGGFTAAAIGTEKLTTVENVLMKVVFTNKGGRIKTVTLKKYNNSNTKQPVVLGGAETDDFGYIINTGAQKTAHTGSLFFNEPTIANGANGAQIVTFTIQSNDGKSVTHEYTLPASDYMIDAAIKVSGAQQLFTGGSANLQWNYTVLPQQDDLKYERQQSNLCFSEEGNYDFNRAEAGTQKDFEKPTNWVALKQQFFSAALLSKGGTFSSGNAQVTAKPDSIKQLLAANVNMKVPIQGNTAVIPVQWYYGPNDYTVLRGYDNNLYQMVDLGSGMFAFVKYINRWVIMPVFDFLASFISNFGWVIALLTLFIRLVTAPLTYSSYLSGAKMKALRPELDGLKKKFGDDQQGYAMEQMKLFREAGVNPLGGCIPALLQIPIFFALYSFFNSAISLRDQSFLWADDLSRYDTIATLPFSIPFGFGDHISLFTLTAVITSFLISIYNMSMTPQTQDNPALKYMPYIFPFILLFIFNRLPSALTWYYTVSNVITLGLQFVIQNYIINHDKILAQIEQKRKQPKAKSKWAERYAQLMETQKKMQEMKDRNKK